MLHRAVVPPPPLSDSVSLLWMYEGYVLPHPRERLLPTGTVELVIDLREQTDGGGAVVCGPHSQSFEIDTATENAVLGVHFKPGGAFSFLGLPLSELQNLQVALTDLWGAEAADLRDRLLEAGSTELRFRLLAHHLLERAVHPLARHPAVACAMRELDGPRARNVAQVSSDVGLSQRRFIELFRREVGLTPKLFSRVRRFQEVVRSVHGRPEVDWARVALSCGYFDQAHFIHDFKSFSGLTPSSYLALASEHMNHIPLVS